MVDVQIVIVEYTEITIKNIVVTVKSYLNGGKMNKYQEAIDEIKQTTIDEPYELDGWTEYNYKRVFYEDDENIQLLQELIDKVKYIELGKQTEYHLQSAETQDDFIQSFIALGIWYQKNWSNDED